MGREWWSLDFKNLELVLPAWESGEQVMIDLFLKADEPPYFGSYHLLNASIIYKREFDECLARGEKFKDKYKATLYQWVKNFGFAVQYGAMEESGTADRAAHKPGAQSMVAKNLTKLEALNKRCIEFANANGYIETMPDKEVGSYPLQVPYGWGNRVKPTVPL